MLPADVCGFPGRILGIDAGGDTTKQVMAEGGRLRELAAGPPMNALLTDDLAERLRGLVCPTGAAAVGIGMAGLRSAADARRLGVALSGQLGCPVRVTDDIQIARLGAFAGGPGTVVIAGTGSAAAGSDGLRSARAGGHGFLVGDEGSAYWLGREAVRAALRWEDRMGGSARIHQAVTSATGTSLAGLIRELHARPAERHRLALLAPVITALAVEDTQARRIARQAARHLAALAAAVQRRIGPQPVAGAGGVFRSEVIWERFAQLTGASRPLAPAAAGAVILAVRQQAAP
ncbi:MAG: ATPase [Actinobacteria bacterium]|nr:ATPase [Actinomycetota bacterium]